MGVCAEESGVEGVDAEGAVGGGGDEEGGAEGSAEGSDCYE